MDPFGLGGYGSSEEGNQPEASNPAAKLSDDEDATSSSSLGSADMRALEAEAKLRDFNQTAKKVQTTSLLPPPSAVFDEVDGPPAFLDPEATRPIATVSHGAAAGAAPTATQATKAKQAPGPDFDISKLAPKLKGQKREGEEKGVIEAKAKRYKQEDGVEPAQQYSAVQIAMLGGSVASPAEKEDKMKRPSKPQDVNEFLSKGEGAALLPRKTQERKEKEKSKKGKGQLGHERVWKTEAEMVLRQQFDS